MECLVFAAMLACSFLTGKAAFSSGLPVFYWSILGGLLGPLVYPLFSTHKRFSIKRLQRPGDVILLS